MACFSYFYNNCFREAGCFIRAQKPKVDKKKKKIKIESRTFVK